MKTQKLSTKEKAELVQLIIESVEDPIDFDEFQEMFGQLCEDIPGLESISEKQFTNLVTDCWEIFLKINAQNDE